MSFALNAIVSSELFLGQVSSLTSTNNFINFCLTVPNLPITNGQQIQSGSCNPAPIGVIPSTEKMPSSKFTNPKNGETIPSGTDFTISMVIKNLQTGNFVNAQQNYFAAPQQLNGGGTIVGHSHVVVEKLSALDQTTPTNPKEFIFFKVRELVVILNISHSKILQGLNAAAQGGILTADVPGGVPAGAYRLCSINTSSNHQPVIVPVAQHGSLDDCVYVSPPSTPRSGATLTEFNFQVYCYCGGCSCCWSTSQSCYIPSCTRIISDCTNHWRSESSF